VLEVLAGSRRSPARMRGRARIVVLVASGVASRAVPREAGCTPGTASKWRVRFASGRMIGLDEAGDRGWRRLTPVGLHRRKSTGRMLFEKLGDGVTASDRGQSLHIRGRHVVSAHRIGNWDHLSIRLSNQSL
jgi:hypothetical protein